MGKHLICTVLAVALLLRPTLLHAAESQNKGSSEFFAINREGRLLVSVQVWGDMSLNGNHHVPDNTTLLQLLGYAGGLHGALDDAKVTIRRVTDPKVGHEAEILVIPGTELVGASSRGNMIVQNGDIIYVETAPPGEVTMRTLTLISTIVGIVSGALLVFYLVKQKN